MSRGGRPENAWAAAAPTAHPVGAAVCTACALLCTDVAPGAVPITGDQCPPGREAVDRRAAGPSGPEAMIDGAPADRGSALAEAAARLRTARRVLVAGLSGATVEDAAAACDVAEALGAALLGAPGREAAIARSGAVTGAWEELRDRADLVVFWFHDPRLHWPRFADRFVAPALAGAATGRVTLSVGPRALRPLPVAGHVHLDLAAEREADLARLLEATLLGRPFGAADAALAAAADTLRTAVASARCVGLVTGPGSAGGPVRVALTGLLRALVVERPAFETPISADGPNGAGAAALLAWRYGTAAGVACAGAPARPIGERPFDALGALAAGAFDAVLDLGGQPAALAAAIDASPRPLGVVHVGASPPPASVRSVHLRAPDPGDTPGTLLRPDGRAVEIPGVRRTAEEPTAGDILRGILAALALGRPPRRGEGERP